MSSAPTKFDSGRTGEENGDRLRLCSGTWNSKARAAPHSTCRGERGRCSSTPCPHRTRHCSPPRAYPYATVRDVRALGCGCCGKPR
eukprot:1444117-Prymnesium_polylepis.1